MSKQKVASIQKKIDALEIKLSKMNVLDPAVAEQVKEIKNELVVLHTTQDAE